MFLHDLLSQFVRLDLSLRRFWYSLLDRFCLLRCLGLGNRGRALQGFGLFLLPCSFFRGLLLLNPCFFNDLELSLPASVLFQQLFKLLNVGIKIRSSDPLHCTRINQSFKFPLLSLNHCLLLPQLKHTLVAMISLLACDNHMKPQLLPLFFQVLQLLRKSLFYFPVIRRNLSLQRVNLASLISNFSSNRVCNICLLLVPQVRFVGLGIPLHRLKLRHVLLRPKFNFNLRCLLLELSGLSQDTLLSVLAEVH